MSSLTEEFINAPSLSITLSVERLEEQCNALCEEVGRFQEHDLVCESELIMELKKVKAKAAELKRYFDASASLVLCLEGELARLKGAQAE